MRPILAMLCLAVPLAALAQAAGEPAPAAKPRSYALVAALGERFHIVVEKMSTGSHLPPYERKRLEEAGAAANVLVVRELARQVAALDPGSSSALMVFPVPPMPGVSAAQRPQAILDAAVAELKQAPARSGWDRILIVTPAYRALRKDGMASQLDGVGLFVDPLCESDVTSCEYGIRPLSGPVTQGPEGKIAPANSFFAPFLYVTLWELDAATFEVIAKREVFRHQKMSSDDPFRPAAIGETERSRINVQLVSLVNESVREALKKTDLVGHVEARQVQEVEASH